MEVVGGRGGKGCEGGGRRWEERSDQFLLTSHNLLCVRAKL